mmetsp:Transcript_110508/g.317791  ORF Transcript_110508/g.317791 Transcript_110508/m.317791 type:complete len:215 (-) Transcript_110508:1852-2496(-)
MAKPLHTMGSAIAAAFPSPGECPSDAVMPSATVAADSTLLPRTSSTTTGASATTASPTTPTPTAMSSSTTPTPAPVSSTLDTPITAMQSPSPLWMMSLSRPGLSAVAHCLGPVWASSATPDSGFATVQRRGSRGNSTKLSVPGESCKSCSDRDPCSVCACNFERRSAAARTLALANWLSALIDPSPRLRTPFLDTEATVSLVLGNAASSSCATS